MENIEITATEDTTVEAQATPDTDFEIVPKNAAIRLAGRPFLLVKVIQRAAVTKYNDWVEETSEATETEEAVTTLRRVERTKTHKKGWHRQPGQMVSFEQTAIVDRIKNRHLTDANVIIDILRGELIKSNIRTQDGASDDMIVEHYLSKYMEDCKKGIDVYLTRMAQAHLKDNSLESLKAKLAASAPEIDLDDAEVA